MSDTPKIPKDAPLQPANEQKALRPLGPETVPGHNYRSSVMCGCGLWRLLPASAKEGDEVTLVPCPKCGWAPTLRHLGDCVELVLDRPAAYEGEVAVTPIQKTSVQ